MIDLTLVGWAVLAFSALSVGLSKTGLPGLLILASPLLAAVMDAKLSVGLLLPMLIVGDCFAVGFYRRHTQWKRLAPLLPWAAAGIALGYLILQRIDGELLRPLIGWAVLVMLGVMVWREVMEARSENEDGLRVPEGWWFAALCGVTAGIVTTLANAAGPIMILYLLAMKLPKREFVGTAAWFFMIVNLTKVPLYVAEGMITPASLLTNLVVTPLIAVGALAGLRLLKKIREDVFKYSVIVLSALAALRLVWPTLTGFVS